jgi:hypothetical protein
MSSARNHAIADDRLRLARDERGLPQVVALAVLELADLRDHRAAGHEVGVHQIFGLQRADEIVDLVARVGPAKSPLVPVETTPIEPQVTPEPLSAAVG